MWLGEHIESEPMGLDLASRIEWGRSWQRKLAAASFVGIDWPEEYGGKGASPIQVAMFNKEYARSGAPDLVNRVGLNLAAPTLLAHGTREQCRRFLPGIRDASDIWCQLFSEPGAGSDLGSLSTRAVAAGRSLGYGFVVTGQKVWTSYAAQAGYGLCLARCRDPGDGPGDGRVRGGMVLCVIDMGAPGVSVRPLRQITGDEEFNEVFLDEVVVPAGMVIGEAGDGWRVAATTLAHERGTNFPMKEEVRHERYLAELLQLATESGAFSDELMADRLVDAFVELLVLRTQNWRTLSALAKGIPPGPESSIVKLEWTSLTQHLSDTALALLGERAPGWGRWQRQWLWSKAAGIAGGTSEIQRNIIGERILGLPREPRPASRL